MSNPAPDWVVLRWGWVGVVGYVFDAECGQLFDGIRLSSIFAAIKDATLFFELDGLCAVR